jgi:pimeloyl-ACP methyl ester carboxylesterase
MAARTRRARVDVLPGVGHFGPMEDPARVAASIIAGMDAWE